MRITDHRYAAELDKFDLAVRMIQHEARTGTIRACTGFSEDRIRKIYSTYFKVAGGRDVKRRRGKSPKRITQFVNSAPRQLEATVLAGLFLLCEAGELGGNGRLERTAGADRVVLGQRLCQAFETYRGMHPDPLDHQKALAAGQRRHVRARSRADIDLRPGAQDQSLRGRPGPGILSAGGSLPSQR